MERNEIRTDNIPIYYQKRLVTKDDLKEYVTFAKLIQNPIVNLNYILLKMEEDYGRCEDDFESRRSKLSSQACLKYQNALREYENEISRFHNGIKQIEYKDFVRKAFYYMNKTFQTKLDGQSRNITGWRLFQIVFIVSMIGEVIHSEYRDDASLTYADIDVANLLYFPTGGGKTEAFLGITVFAMFFDRLRGKTQGITAFLKYPLRLLAVQQLDRILAIVMQANVVRQENIELALATEFRVGFYVGKDNTPNKISKNEKLSSRGERQQNLDLLLESDQDTLNEYYRFIDKCPCCGKKMINVRFNKERWVLEHICDNPDCPADVLPLFIVDSEIYRYLPSIVVSTIDKMSLIGILAKIIEEDFGNSQAAIEWYRKAVLNENKEAMLGLSRIYINTQSNCQEAVQMLSKLISEKNGEAQYLYAQCLENGYGCTKDKREAKKYYQLAQSNGYEGAKRKKRFGFF